MSSPTFITTSQQGGNGGTAFDDSTTFPQISDYRLSNINYWTNSSIIRGIQFQWESPRGDILDGAVHGASSDTYNSFALPDRRERIIIVAGRSGSRVDALTLITNQGRSVNFGGNGGTPFQWVINFTEHPNVALHHLKGKSGSDVDALAAVFVVRDAE